MNKRLIVVGGLILTAIVALFIGSSYFLSLQKVTLVYNPNEGSVYVTGDHINGKLTPAPNEQIMLQKGVYQIHITGDNAKADTRTLIVQDAPITQTVPISLPDKTLQTLLGAELPAITKIIAQKYPTLSSLYDIKDHLYDRGQWYGAVLTYKGTDTDNRDTLRLVAHKEAGQWQLVASPRLIVSSVEFPSIPKDILDDLNKPSYLPGTATSPAIYPN